MATTAEEDAVCVTVSALDAGHLTLPERLFVTEADPEKRPTVPSLSFLVQHAPSGTRLVFDLGVKRDISGYTEAQRAHIAQRQPVITDPDCAASLRAARGGVGGEGPAPLDPARDIDVVVLSHVHWDHVGTPSDFTSAAFVVGAGTLDVLKNGAGPLYPAALFNDDELPVPRCVELPPAPSWPYTADYPPPRPTATPAEERARLLPAAAREWAWQPLSLGGGFVLPDTLDFFGDGSLFVVDSPGHLYGHVNLLARLGPRRYAYLGGDCCHDPRILEGERGIAMYDDGTGRLRSVHVDTAAATATVARIKEFVDSARAAGDLDVEVVVAHDSTWRERNRHRFWPGTL